MEDYPLVRGSLRCPSCRGYKDSGLVLCWSCYGRLNARNGGGEAAIGAEEAALMRAAVVAGGAR